MQGPALSLLVNWSAAISLALVVSYTVVLHLYCIFQSGESELAEQQLIQAVITNQTKKTISGTHLTNKHQNQRRKSNTSQNSICDFVNNPEVDAVGSDLTPLTDLWAGR